MANTPKDPNAPKKFHLSLELPLEYKARFEKIAQSENRSVKAQAMHVLIKEIERASNPQPTAN